jgi:hypothetical protein
MIKLKAFVLVDYELARQNGPVGSLASRRP